MAKIMEPTNFGTQIEDVEAIDRYMRSHPLVTPEAFQIKDAYIRWYDSKGWWDKNMSAPFYDEIRTRRNQLNIANQPTAAKKEAIKDQLARGIETEEMQGKKRPPVDRDTGRVGTQVSKPTVQPTPSTMPKAGAPLGPVYPTIRKGSADSKTVKVWQAIIGVSADGVFGNGTEAATKTWQKAHGLSADGVVGPATWAIAFPKAEGLAPAPIPQPVPAPSPKPAAGKPSAAKPASPAKPAADTKPVSPAKEKVKQAAAKTKKAAVATAGMLDVMKWPTWAKVLGGLSLVGAAAAAAVAPKGSIKFGSR